MKTKICLIVVCLVTLTPTATAQENPSEGVARGLFEAGRSAYDSGNYREALDFFQQAYEHSQRPRLLYNIGQSADRLRMDRTALSAFRRYLELTPDAENRVEVENRIRALEGVVIESDPAPEPVAAVPEPIQTPPTPVLTLTPQTPKSKGPSVAPWLVLGFSGASIVTGVTFFVIGTNQINAVENAPPGSDWKQVRANVNSGPDFQNVGVTLAIFGAIGTVVGVVWVLTDDHEDDTETEFVVGPGSLTLRGSL